MTLWRPGGPKSESGSRSAGGAQATGMGRSIGLEGGGTRKFCGIGPGSMALPACRQPPGRFMPAFFRGHRVAEQGSCLPCSHRRRLWNLRTAFHVDPQKETRGMVLRYSRNSPSRTRTYNLAVNSRSLYRLSYRGILPLRRRFRQRQQLLLIKVGSRPAHQAARRGAKKIRPSTSYPRPGGNYDRSVDGMQQLCQDFSYIADRKAQRHWTRARP